MARINLRELYNIYQEDCFIEVSEELSVLLQQLDRMEHAQQRKQFRYRAYLSLDRGDGIERHAVSMSLSPEANSARRNMISIPGGLLLPGIFICIEGD